VAVITHVDDKMQGHASLITNTLSSHISEVQENVRHLDTAMQTSDRELRQDIKEVREDLHTVRSDVRSVSSDLESLAEDVRLLTEDMRPNPDLHAFQKTRH
jgi:polyhydroxyalkanoate synthesis regulator phasin